MQQFSEFDEYSQQLSYCVVELASLRGDYIEAKIISRQKLIPTEGFKKCFERINQLIDLIQNISKEQFQSTELSSDWKEKLDAINLANRVSALAMDIDTLENDLKEYHRKIKLAEVIYNTFNEVKTEKIIKTYNAIKDNINSYYTTLHPDDPHRNIEINVIAGRRASTNLRIRSFGLFEDPRAYTSEGHLDSLGLCIFLAFAKKFNSDCSLIVLDDVITTVDAKHRSLVAKLLFEEFKNYQLVITTHDSIWYEQLCAAERACGISGNCKNMEIVKWTLESGPQIEPYKPHWESILNRINNGDKTGAGEEGRIYLEWLLKRICLNTQTPVILKMEKYTIADLYEPAKKRLLAIMTDSDYKQMLQDAFSELDSISLMGNLLSHDNSDAGNASIEEVTRFCYAVHAIRIILQCPNCDSFFKYYQDFRRLRCTNARCSRPTEIL